jgi:transposase
MPVRVIVTDGTTADCAQASKLIDGIEAGALPADRAYDTNEIVEKREETSAEAVMPPKKNRTAQREYDKHLYKLRHLVENAFLHLKRWRGRATRCAKHATSFLAIAHIRCIALWLIIY